MFHGEMQIRESCHSIFKVESVAERPIDNHRLRPVLVSCVVKCIWLLVLIFYPRYLLVSTECKHKPSLHGAALLLVRPLRVFTELVRAGRGSVDFTVQWR